MGPAGREVPRNPNPEVGINRPSNSGTDETSLADLISQHTDLPNKFQVGEWAYVMMIKLDINVGFAACEIRKYEEGLYEVVFLDTTLSRATGVAGKQFPGVNPQDVYALDDPRVADFNRRFPDWDKLEEISGLHAQWKIQECVDDLYGLYRDLHETCLTIGAPSQSGDTLSGSLYPPWEARTNDEGTLYYVNHHTKATQWERPPPEAYKYEWTTTTGEKVEFMYLPDVKLPVYYANKGVGEQ